MTYILPVLPLALDIETKAVIKKTVEARSALAEMKGAAVSIPDVHILISTLSLQEAKDSSAIENIFTTHDELYRSDYQAGDFRTIASKEVHNYALALRTGFDIVKQQGFLSNNHLLKIQAIIEENSAGFRKLPGTKLKNEQTGETVYTPPQSGDEVLTQMGILEQFINDPNLCDWDPLVKMAVIHHQFESIHPFYDGNGRTGRIINILYLVMQGLLDIPILYLSRYINLHKNQYYRLLQRVRTDNGWEAWVLYILEAVEQTSRQTTATISSVKILMEQHKRQIRTELPKIYSQDLLNNIFRHPYTKIDFVKADMAVSRPTATRYLQALTDLGVLEKEKFGKDNYYINKALFQLLATGNLNVPK